MSLESLINKVQTRTDDISDGQYFVNILKEGVQKRNNANLRKPSTYYSPSSLGNCPRQLYYKRTGSPIDDKQDIEPKNILKGETGTDRHERIQELIVWLDENEDYDFEWLSVRNYIKEKGLNHLEVIKDDGLEALVVDKRYNIRFKVDGLLTIRGNTYLLEIKTDDTYRWKGRNKVSKYHRFQGYSYSLSFGIDRVLYIYEERNNFQKKPIHKKVTDEDRKELTDKIEMIEEHLEKGKLPKKDLTSCNFCMYKTICKKDYNPKEGEK